MQSMAFNAHKFKVFMTVAKLPFDETAEVMPGLSLGTRTSKSMALIIL